MIRVALITRTELAGRVGLTVEQLAPLLAKLNVRPRVSGAGDADAMYRPDVADAIREHLITLPACPGCGRPLLK